MELDFPEITPELYERHAIYSELTRPLYQKLEARSDKSLS